ncbi:hypothetical protein [Vibrio spartinae]|uniref:Transposase n=1 Tax=Vibrio spartinae TaxID=1918945 RepID=A0A1N6M7H7_9VIBR|nr:hypothetical protein [Vibrio spartinae]SIO95403.1 hypothetical protein VSP9026_03146 [Vibrio spartinae]
MNTTIIGVDLATKAIQVCVYAHSKVQSNKELTPQQFNAFLRQQSPCVVVFESCSGSNYWAQYWFPTLGILGGVHQCIRVEFNYA